MNELIDQLRDGLYRMTLTVGAHSARHIRRIVRAHLRLWGMTALADAAEIAVTELVANVVRHVPDRHCTVAILRRPSGLRVEVSDGSPVPPAPRQASALDETGRGLALLALITDAWDWELRDDGPGKTIWFELKAAEPGVAVM